MVWYMPATFDHRALVKTAALTPACACRQGAQARP